jgi:hypothetical protein
LNTFELPQKEGRAIHETTVMDPHQTIVSWKKDPPSHQEKGLYIDMGYFFDMYVKIEIHVMMMSFICFCRNKIGAELHTYLEEGTYHKRLFTGPNTNDLKK